MGIIKHKAVWSDWWLLIVPGVTLALSAVILLLCGTITGAILKQSPDGLETFGLSLATASVTAAFGGIPGFVAKRRGVKAQIPLWVLGYVGVFLFAIPWALALVWACTDKAASAPGESTEESPI